MVHNTLSENETLTIGFVGATPNFFKAGHTALRLIANKYPNVKLRLGLISDMVNCPDIVKDLELSGRLAYYTWPLGDETLVYSKVKQMYVTAEMNGLIELFNGCTAAFLSPPIDGRIEIGRKYIEALAIVDVSHFVMLGVQYQCEKFQKEFNQKPPQIANDADQLYDIQDEILKKYQSKMKYLILHLPMFLENILYQTNRLINEKIFTWPIKRDSVFSYVTCKDLGVLVADFLVSFDKMIQLTNNFIVVKSKNRLELEIVTGWTSANNLETYLREYVDKKIKYKQQTRSSFLNELIVYLDKSDVGAETIAELYDLIDRNQDVKVNSNNLFECIGFGEPQTDKEWIVEHRNCFLIGEDHAYPLPPSEHMAPILNDMFI